MELFVSEEGDQAMVYHALTAEIPLAGGRAIPGLGRNPQALREMEFLFPLPEASHPRLTEALSERLTLERGFLKGFVDLVTEHDGRVYFADWKSDVLPSYDPERMTAHVERAYGIQARLYALALVKALGIRSAGEYEDRFGGMVYVFLRGLRPPAEPGQGLHFSRPAWADILAYEQELIHSVEPARTAGNWR